MVRAPTMFHHRSAPLPFSPVDDLFWSSPQPSEFVEHINRLLPWPAKAEPRAVKNVPLQIEGLRVEQREPCGLEVFCLQAGLFGTSPCVPYGQCTSGQVAQGL